MSHLKSNGFRVEAHAIGDRAATYLVDAFEKYMPSTERPVLTHCQQLGAITVGWHGIPKNG
jgi:predicted amidohydrolase YtcJ